jgi:hypothetical protein
LEVRMDQAGRVQHFLLPTVADYSY